MPNVANDLSQKLYATMEKHKEVYYMFFICLLTCSLRHCIIHVL